MADILTITDSNFETEVLGSEDLTMVDFWAAWCGPCKMIAPVLEEIADEYAGKLKLGKLNVDENQTTPTQFGIMSIPTLILFKDGKELERIIGFKTKQELSSIINKHL
ncbi:MAG: thioredoxin 1 [Clostridia bacterium]|nr:thioredoxin [Clostridiales bacterium]MDK2986585.1 thioredoxin 1 [Clostridia bacterium]